MAAEEKLKSCMSGLSVYFWGVRQENREGVFRDSSGCLLDIVDPVKVRVVYSDEIDFRTVSLDRRMFVQKHPNPHALEIGNFALQGLGTPAPIAPPQNLVVTGLYRYVRNPMYVAVVAVTLGQGILFGDWRLLIYGGLMWLAFHAFVLAYEEPVLAESFGAQYEDFRANVPRWIPRLSSWRRA